MYSHNKTTFSVNCTNAAKPANVVNKRQSSNAFPALQSTRILDQVRERVCYVHDSKRTEEAHPVWIRLFIRWSGNRNPSVKAEWGMSCLLPSHHIAARGVRCGLPGQNNARDQRAFGALSFRYSFQRKLFQAWRR